MDLVLRVVFFALLRPAGLLLRLRQDPLQLEQPGATNWRPIRR